MDEMEIKGEYPPKPTPLCYWCPFHSTSPNADPKFSGLCQYHSLWTPEKKSFAVLNPYGQEIKKAKCPQCGGELVFEGGCNTCKNCGWSKCD